MSCSRYLFQAVETNSREIEDNPNEKGIPTRYAFLRSEFSSPRDDLRARILQNRAASPFLPKPFGKSGKKGKSVVLPFSSDYLNSPSSQKQKFLQIGLRCAPTSVYFAKRPLADIESKLTELRDNFVIAKARPPSVISSGARQEPHGVKGDAARSREISQ